MTWGLAADGVLAVLLVVTIGYAALLNRRLSALRESRSAMEALIADFSAAIERAESGLVELKRRAEVAGGELAKHLEDANGKLERVQGLNDELAFLVEKGGAVAERLERGIEGSRRLGAAQPDPTGAKPQKARPSPLSEENAGLRRALETLR